MKNHLLTVIILIASLTNAKISFSQSDTFRVLTLDNPAPGYLRANTISDNKFRLLDNAGNLIFNQPQKVGQNFYKFHPNKRWTYFEETRVLLYDENMRLVDSIYNPTSYELDYHDILLLSNGHYLLLLNERIPVDMSEIVDGGYRNATLISSYLVETDNSGTIYWSWRSYDKVNITDVTSDVDLTSTIIDLTHINSLFEDNDGNIIVSVRHFDEIWKINKTNGNLMWRFGGSSSKNNQFTISNDTRDGFTGFSHQHSAHRLSNGNLLMFDNGNLKPTQYSRAVEYEINETAKTARKVWEYRHNPEVYSFSMGNTQRLPNGNTLINWAYGSITEVKPDGSVALEMEYGNHGIYSAERHITKMDAVTKLVSSTGSYDFSNSDYKTNVVLNLTSVSGSGAITIEKHNYAPVKSTFSDNNFTTVLPYRWVITKKDISSIDGFIKIKGSVFNNYKVQNLRIYKRSSEIALSFDSIKTTYNTADKEISAQIKGFGEFVIVSMDVIPPVLSYPENNSKAETSGKLTWEKAQLSVKYRIQLANNYSFFNPIIDSVVERLDISYSNLSSNVKYFWRVKSYNSTLDSSAWSSSFNFTTKITPPTLVYPLDRAKNIHNNETIKWAPIPEPIKYHLQISMVRNFYFQIVDTVTSSINYTLYGLSNSTDYFWRVRAFNPEDTSSWSTIYSFTTSIGTPVLIAPPNDTLNVDINPVLNWQTVAGADAYTVHLSENSDFKILFDSAVSIATNHYNFKNLNHFKKYYWRVRAEKGSYNSLWSKPAAFTTLKKPVKLVFPDNTAGNVSTSPNLKWEQNEAGEIYRVQVSIESNFSNPFQDTVLSSRNLDLLKLQSARKYYWRVRAITTPYLSSWSATYSFTTINRFSSQVLNLTAPFDGDTVSINEELIWEKVDEAVNYRVQVAKDAGFTNKILSKVVNATIFTLDNAEYGKNYFWRVKAFSLKDSTQWSKVGHFTTLNKDDVVMLISPAFDELCASVESKFEWMPLENSTSYDLELSESKDFLNPIINQKNITKTSLDYKLESGKSYYWRVKAYKNGYPTRWSQIWQFSTSLNTVLEKPEPLLPANNSSGVPVTGAITWKELPGAESYSAAISLKNDFSVSYTKTEGITSNSFSYENLNYNTRYFWRISANNASGPGYWSATRSFLTELLMPNVMFPEDGMSNIPIYGTIFWNEEEETSSYILQLAMDSEFNQLVLEIKDIYVNSYEYSLEPNKVYYLRVKGTTAINNSRWSTPVSFRTQKFVSAEIEQEPELMVYPNPAKDYILVPNGEYEMPYRIYTTTGDIMMSGIILDKKLIISSLPAGLYYLKAGDKTVKIIKN